MSDEPDEKLHPLVTTDIALFCVDGPALRVLLTRRGNAPERGRWALPGGFLRPAEDETLDHAARRVLREKAGVDVPHLEQVRVFSGRARDARGWSLSLLYFALLPKSRVPAVATGKTVAVDWADPAAPGRRLAFDHGTMLATALEALREKVRDRVLPLQLLGERFTLTELQRACEAVLGAPLDKGAFRRRLKNREGRDFVALPGEFETGRQRPAQYYRAAEDFGF